MADSRCHPSTGLMRPGSGVLVHLLGLAAVAGVGRVMLGPTLGLVFFLPIVVALATLAPSAARSGRETLVRDLSASFVACLFAIDIGSWGALGQLFIVTLALALAGNGVRLLLARLIRLPGLSETAAMVVVLAWLTLPVWLSPRWPDGPITDRLLDAHPLLTLNGVYAHLGDWTHAPLAYSTLTNLNQDIPYALPASIAWCVTGHGIVAITTIAISSGIAGWRPWRRGDRSDCLQNKVVPARE